MSMFLVYMLLYLFVFVLNLIVTLYIFWYCLVRFKSIPKHLFSTEAEHGELSMGSVDPGKLLSRSGDGPTSGRKMLQ